MLRKHADVLRIIDANRNRALEALRVLEEAARLVLDSQDLSAQAKSLRHEIAGLLKPFERSLVSARRIEDDVGVRVSVESELGRTGIKHVVAANASRLKESLRVLEEYGKILESAVGKAMQELRYDYYSFERRLLQRLNPRVCLKDTLLCVIVSMSDPRGPVETARLAIQGGADIIQFREKKASDRELLETAEKLRSLTEEKGTLFIVNDRPDIACACGADGVHLGLDDLPVKEARRLLGPDSIIGASAHGVGEAVTARDEGANYLGAGSFFPTSTKGDAVVRGGREFGEIAASVEIPCFAIGGITSDNIREVVDAGAIRVAVASGVSNANDPVEAAKIIKEILAGAIKREKKSSGD